MELDLAKYPQDVAKKLEYFFDTAGGCVEAFADTLATRKVPALVYHYTDDRGLRGILESGTLWCSDIFGLNDPSELSHGMAPAVSLLTKMSDGAPVEHQEFARRFAQFHQSLTQDMAQFFVCCFSTNHDDLGQWRAYADDGVGYALGFQAGALSDLFAERADTPSIATFPMTYDDAALTELHQQILDLAFPLIGEPRRLNIVGADAVSYFHHLLVHLSMAAVHAALHFKHPAYAPEAEFRFMQMHPANSATSGVKYRHGRQELIKYKEFPWKKPGMLRHIVIGPAADKIKGRRYVEDCLKAFHGDQAGDVKITESRIPYRSVG